MVDQAVFKEKIISYVENQDIIEEGMQKPYSLIMGKCREGVQSKFKGMPDHSVIADNRNPVLLLGNINTMLFNFQLNKYLSQTMHN